MIFPRLYFTSFHICGFSVVLNNRRLSPSSSFKSLHPVALYIPSIFYLLQGIHFALRDLGILGYVLTFLFALTTTVLYYLHSTQCCPSNSYFLQLHDFPPCFSDSSTSPEIHYCWFYPSYSSLVRLVHRLERKISACVDRYWYEVPYFSQ